MVTNARAGTIYKRRSKNENDDLQAYAAAAAAAVAKAFERSYSDFHTSVFRTPAFHSKPLNLRGPRLVFIHH